VCFFKCDELGGTEKRVGLQEISLEETLDKVMGRKENKSKRLLKVIVKEGSMIVAYIFTRAWRGCKIHKKLKIDGKNRYKLIIDKAEKWKVISVFILGIREYVESLRLRLGLLTQQATAENILCEKQQCEAPFLTVHCLMI